MVEGVNGPVDGLMEQEVVQIFLSSFHPYRKEPQGAQECKYQPCPEPEVSPGRPYLSGEEKEEEDYEAATKQCAKEEATTK